MNFIDLKRKRPPISLFILALIVLSVGFYGEWWVKGLMFIGLLMNTYILLKFYKNQYIEIAINAEGICLKDKSGSVEKLPFSEIKELRFENSFMVFETTEGVIKTTTKIANRHARNEFLQSLQKQNVTVREEVDIPGGGD